MDTIFTLKGMDLDKMFDYVVKWLLSSGIHILIIVIIAGVGLKLGRVFIKKSLSVALRDTGKSILADIQTDKRRRTLETLFTGILRVTIIVVAGLMIFQEIGLAIGPVLASAGIVGVAIGFGAQSLVKDIITGAFIVLEQQFNIGDVVKIGDRAGAVESMGIRTTTLRDGDGVAHIIPNSKIDSVSVFTKGWSQLQLDVDVTYDADVDRVISIIENVLNDYAKEYSTEVIEQPKVLGIEALGENSLKIRSTIKTAPGKQWDAGRIIRLRIKKAFEQNGIQIPFQQSAAWIRPQMLSASSGGAKGDETKSVQSES
jgi:small-conductance mechanosensitive channel